MRRAPHWRGGVLRRWWRPSGDLGERVTARSYLGEIDAIARRMLGLAAAPAGTVEETAGTESVADEEEADMAD
ncbi:MAG TPA: hypothetical protein VGF38_02645 [Ktedonobacterales bacterium]